MKHCHRMQQLLVFFILLTIGSPSLLNAVSLNPDQIKAAGCLIQYDEKVVAAVHRVSNTLVLPIGTHKTGEFAKQTAQRETYEETGLSVIVGQHIHTFNKDVLLFNCSIPNAKKVFSRQIIPRDNLEIAEVVLINPKTMLQNNGRISNLKWRYDTTAKFLNSIF